MSRLLFFAVIAIGLVVLYRRYVDQQRSNRLRQLFANDRAIIGLSPLQVQEVVGPWQFFGAMDHGDEVASWQGPGLWVEVWFKQGRAVAVVDRSDPQPPAGKG